MGKQLDNRDIVEAMISCAGDRVGRITQHGDYLVTWGRTAQGSMAFDGKRRVAEASGSIGVEIEKLAKKLKISFRFTDR